MWSQGFTDAYMIWIKSTSEQKVNPCSKPDALVETNVPTGAQKIVWANIAQMEEQEGPIFFLTYKWSYFKRSSIAW